jgi:nucleoside-diphosphate-sugar epimerase
LQGQSPYSASKIAADKLVESYWCSFGLPVATLRPFNTFGPRQSARAVIPTIISQLHHGGPVRLGSLSPVRDLTFVADTVRAFIALAECDAAIGLVCNAGNGKGITIGDLASRLVEMIRPGAELTTEHARVRPEHSEVMALIADASRLRELTGWYPQVDLQSGLAATIDFVERYPELFKHSRYVI